MRFSIIMPVLDEGEGIAATLDALGELRALGAEVIVVDGGSRDATIQRARLRADYTDRARRPIVLRFEEHRFTLTPRAAHLRADITASVQQAIDRTRAQNLFTRVLRALTGGRVDAAFGNDPFVTQMIKAGSAVPLVDLFVPSQARRALGFRDYCFTGALTRADGSYVFLGALPGDYTVDFGTYEHLERRAHVSPMLTTTVDSPVPPTRYPKRLDATLKAAVLHQCPPPSYPVYGYYTLNS